MYKFIQNLFDKIWQENIVAQFILDPYDLDMFFKMPNKRLQNWLFT